MAALRSVVLVMVTVLAGGCADDPAAPVDEPLPLTPDANGCTVVASLDGAQSESMQLGPYVFGTGTFCLHLDASQLRRGHFMASTRNEPGSASGFSIEMTSSDGSPLATGGDITVGQTDPMTFASLELAITGGTELDVRLIVSSADHATAINVALFDPLE
jgi:hypothetical protein